MKTRASLLLLLVLLGFAEIARAQDSLDGRSTPSEWEVRPTPEPYRAAPTPVPRDCSKDDDNVCRDECYREFGESFHRCTAECLGLKCKKIPVKSRKEREEEAKLQARCLEEYSSPCRSECTEGSENSRMRCRRACLERECPGADRYEISSESFDPGVLGCNRCKKEHERICARTCAYGVPDSYRGDSALKVYGCEKVCLMTACSESCKGRIPSP